MSLAQKLATVGLDDRWKASTLTFLSLYSINFPQGVPFFKPDGTKMYSFASNLIREYSLSSPWDLSTITQSATKFVNYLDVSTAIVVSSDGLKLYAKYENPSTAEITLREYNLSSAWDLSSTLTFSSEFSPGENIGEFFFSNDGTLLFVNSYKYTLSSAWDISTATLSQTNVNARNLFYKPDGSRAYKQVTGKLGEYVLSTPWDINTISLKATSSENSPSRFFIKPDGSRLYAFEFRVFSGISEYSMG